MSETVELSALSWIAEAAGDKLLAYILSTDSVTPETLLRGEHPLTKKQTEVANTFIALQDALPRELDETNKKEVTRGWLTQSQDNGDPVAKSLHEHCGGIMKVPPGQDDLERALTTLAVNAYPAYLLSPDTDTLPMKEAISSRVIQYIINSPQAATFFNVALNDPTIKNIFTSANKHTGHIGRIYRNTGNGGTVQLSMLPKILLDSAWRHARAADPSSEIFAAQAATELRLIRDVLSGKRRTVSAVLAFTGVLLPPSGRLRLRDGLVRPVTEADRKLAPDSLKAQISGTDNSGNTTISNYDGDVIFEFEFPYKIRVESSGLETPMAWPEDMKPPAALWRAATRLRFSLMLAVERESRAQLVQTWQYFDEPFAHGFAVTWSDPRQGTGFMPIRLTNAEIKSWEDWYEKLNTSHVDRVELALTRILRAIAERREPSDVLIDSVIAWENLFGTRDGEPTLRTTACLAKLLASSFQERKKLKKALADIYRLRSNVVHGNENLRASDYPKCQEALNVAVRAIRVLATERIDILELHDGAERSITLLLEN